MFVDMLRHIKGGGMNKRKNPEGKLFCHILAINFIVFSCFSRVVREVFLVYSEWSLTDNKCKCCA